MKVLTIRLLRPADIQPITDAFNEIGWNKPVSQYEMYLREQEAGRRVVLVALEDGRFAGYLTICWQSPHYKPFQEKGIPEIVDFNVLPHFRRMGIGTCLMDAAEERISATSKLVGIGVGMTADYGAAQRMYARRGYLPDGSGLNYRGKPVLYGDTYPVDDDLCLFFTKGLKNATAGWDDRVLSQG